MHSDELQVAQLLNLVEQYTHCSFSSKYCPFGHVKHLLALHTGQSAPYFSEHFLQVQVLSSLYSSAAQDNPVHAIQKLLVHNVQFSPYAEHSV